MSRLEGIHTDFRVWPLTFTKNSRIIELVMENLHTKYELDSPRHCLLMVTTRSVTHIHTHHHDFIDTNVYTGTKKWEPSGIQKFVYLPSGIAIFNKLHIVSHNIWSVFISDNVSMFVHFNLHLFCLIRRGPNLLI